ncbi:MAG: hypothetical protein AAFV53_12810 [Myxococcota bacterium]
MVDPLVETIALPETIDTTVNGWEAAWDIREVTSTSTRAAMEGSLSIRFSRADGVAQMQIYQDIPMYWQLGVETSVALVCQDGLLLRPLRWDTHCITRTAQGEITETLGAHDAYIDDNMLIFDGLSQTAIDLPDAPLTSTWSLLAAFPRIVASGESALSFCVLDELLIARPDQRLIAFGAVEFPTAAGPITLLGYRLLGTGTAPVHYWVTTDGWPMFICGLRRAFVARSITPLLDLER